MGDLRSGPSDERGVTAGGTTEPGAPGRTQHARLALRTGGPGRGSAHPRRRPRPGRRLSSLSGCERAQLSTVVGGKGRKPPTCPTRRWDPGMKLAFLPVKVVGYGQSPVAQLRGGKAMAWHAAFKGMGWRTRQETRWRERAAERRTCHAPCVRSEKAMGTGLPAEGRRQRRRGEGDRSPGGVRTPSPDSPCTFWTASSGCRAGIKLSVKWGCQGVACIGWEGRLPGDTTGEGWARSHRELAELFFHYCFIYCGSYYFIYHKVINDAYVITHRNPDEDPLGVSGFPGGRLNMAVCVEGRSCAPECHGDSVCGRCPRRGGRAGSAGRVG